MITERYRLTLEHDLLVDGKAVKLDDPKCYEVYDYSDHENYISTYKTHIITELFERFLRELLRIEEN